MTREITTRRAIEVCMSRLPMHRDCRDTMARHLQNAIRGQYEATPDTDLDEVRAQLVCIIDDLNGVNETFTKAEMLARIGDARRSIEELL